MRTPEQGAATAVYLAAAAFTGECLSTPVPSASTRRQPTTQPPAASRSSARKWWAWNKGWAGDFAEW